MSSHATQFVAFPITDYAAVQLIPIWGCILCYSAV